MGLTEKYGTLIIALLIGGGFAFGGIASYAGMISTPQSNNNQNEIDSSLPETNYVEGSFDRSMQEKSLIAAQNDVVFIDAYYNGSEQLSQMQEYSELQETFDGRVYISVMDSEENFPPSQVEETPAVVITGSGVQGRQITPRQTIEYDTSTENVGSLVCNYMRNWPDSATIYCAR